MKEETTMNDQEMSQISLFEKLDRREIKQKKVAKTLSLSIRQIKRKLHQYRLYGAKSLAHKSRGKESNNKISQQKLDIAIGLIKKHYLDFGPTLALEKLIENHEISFSVERLRQEMITVGLWKSKNRRKAHFHPLRESRACRGELAQLDGSPHDWFEGRAPKCNLNVDVDDATGDLTLLFSKAETTQDYFRLMERRFTLHGIPLSVYTDRHSIFVVNTPTNLNHKKPKKSQLDEGLTQFGRAMKELGIEHILANSPQAKGRVERANRTLQDRLVKEMRLKGIFSIEEANEFLPEFTKKFNQQFSKPPRSSVNMNRQLPKGLDLSKILCIKKYRALSKNLTCQYNSCIYQIQTKRSAYTLRKTTVTIRERYNGSLTIWDHRGKQLEYTVMKKLPKTKPVHSKELNQLVDDILIKEAKKNYKKKNPWESSFKELSENTGFYKPMGAL